MLVGGVEYKRLTDEIYAVTQCMERLQRKYRIDYIYYHGNELNFDSMSLQELQDLQTSLAGFNIPNSEIYYSMETNIGRAFVNRMTQEFQSIVNSVAIEVGCRQLFDLLPNIATLFNISVYGKDDTMLDVMCKAVTIMVSGRCKLPYGYCRQMGYPYLSSVLGVYGDILRILRFRDKDTLDDETFVKFNLALNMEMEDRNRFIEYLWEHKYDRAYNLISNRAILLRD